MKFTTKKPLLLSAALCALGFVLTQSNPVYGQCAQTVQFGSPLTVNWDNQGNSLSDYPCWGTNGSGVQLHSNATDDGGVFSSPNAVEINNIDGQSLVSPEIKNLGNGFIEVTVRVALEDGLDGVNQPFEVGVASDQNETNYKAIQTFTYVGSSPNISQFEISDPTGMPANYQYTIAFSNPSAIGNRNYIVFKAGSSSSFELAIDDIEIKNTTPPVNDDIAVKAIESPTTQCDYVNGDSVRVKYAARGSQTITKGTSFSVSYTFQGNKVTETHTLQSDKKTGETFTHTFSSVVNPTQDAQNYQISASVNWNQDARAGNDDLTSSFRNEYSPPQPSVIGDTICNGGAATVKVDNPLQRNSTQYTWFNSPMGSKKVGKGPMTTTPPLNTKAAFDSVYVERVDSLPVPLKLSEVKQDNGEGVEVQHMVNDTRDYTGYTVVVYEGDNEFGFDDKISWNLGTFGPYEAKSGRQSAEFDCCIFPFDDVAAMIVGPNGNVVDFFVAFDDDDLQAIDYQVNGFNITISDVDWNGSPRANPNPESFRRVGSKDNNDASDWKEEGLSPGSINPGLNVKNFDLASTCPSIPKAASIKVNPVPDVGFENTPDTICATRKVSFKDTSQFRGSSSLSYEWDIASQKFSGTNANFVFPQSEGTYDVQLRVESGKGCADSVVKPLPVNAKPEPDFATVEVCGGNSTVIPDSTTFIGSGGLSYNWQVQNSTYTDVNPTHTFNPSGSNQVQLAVTSDIGCADTITKSVNILPNPDAQFAVNDGCQGDTLTFQNNTTFSGGSVSNLRANWAFGDGNGVTGVQSPEYMYDSIGSFNARLRVTTPKGCEDITSQPVNIGGLPEADFSFKNTCKPKAVALSNNTSFDGDTADLAFTWDLEGNQVNVEEATYTFSSAQTFPVKLVATNTNANCVDSLTQSVEVIPQPTAEFSVSDGCAGKAVNFDYTGNNPAPSYNWDLGTTTSTMENPAVTYNKPGSYDVSLTVDYYNGRCSMDTTQTLKINPVPTADFAFGIEGPVCEGSEVQLLNNTIFENGDTSNLSYSWAVGSKNFSSKNPSVVLDETGSIDVNLTASTPEGCESMISEGKFVNELPVSDFTLSQVGPAEVRLTAQDNTYVRYRWKLGDNTKVNKPSLNHTYDSNGTYNIELFTKSRAGCTSTTTEAFVLETVSIADQVSSNATMIEAYPNPFEDQARIRYRVDQQADVQIQVVSANGQTLISETYNDRPAGDYSVTLDASQHSASAGAYMVRLRIGEEVYTKQLIRQQ